MVNRNNVTLRSSRKRGQQQTYEPPRGLDRDHQQSNICGTFANRTPVLPCPEVAHNKLGHYYIPLKTMQLTYKYFNLNKETLQA